MRMKRKCRKLIFQAMSAIWVHVLHTKFISVYFFYFLNTQLQILWTFKQSTEKHLECIAMVEYKMESVPITFNIG